MLKTPFGRIPKPGERNWLRQPALLLIPAGIAAALFDWAAARGVMPTRPVSLAAMSVSLRRIGVTTICVPSINAQRHDAASTQRQAIQGKLCQCRHVISLLR